MRPEGTRPTRSLILPPRFEDRAAADEATMMAAIPVYVEEHSASLRPTWLPVDPSTYAPPRIRTKKFSFAMAGKIALGLVATFALSFGMVVAPHFAREFAAKRTLTNASATVAPSTQAIDPIVSVAAPTANANGSAAQTKAAASGVILTVNVNDLPVSRDFPRNRKAGSRRAGS